MDSELHLLYIWMLSFKYRVIRQENMQQSNNENIIAITIQATCEAPLFLGRFNISNNHLTINSLIEKWAKSKGD